jgi:hypothetical protein
MLLLRNIAQVVTLRGGPAPGVGASMSDLGIIENGALLIRGDRIVWVGPTKDIPVREQRILYRTFRQVGNARRRQTGRYRLDGRTGLPRVALLLRRQPLCCHH